MNKEKRQYIYDKLKNSTFKYCKTNFEAKFFIVIVGLSFFFHLIMSMLNGDSYFNDIFFSNCTDTYMDFFNSVRDVSLGAGVYTERGVIYPPMANLLFLVFLKITPAQYVGTDFESRLDWIYYGTNNMIILLFLLIPIIIFLITASKHLDCASPTKGLVLFFLVINAPMLYLIERGNILLYAMVFMFIYAINYDSESKVAREIGLISLAFAFSIKFYPAILGWQLIADKRWKEAIRCVIYALLMLIIPSFFFGGPSCIAQIFKNIFIFSGKRSNDLVPIFEVLKMSEKLGMTIFKIFMTTAFIGWAVSPFVLKNNFKFYTFTIAVISMLPSLYSHYAFAWFVPSIFMFCNKTYEKNANVTSKIFSYAEIAMLAFSFSFSRLNTYVKAYYYVSLVLMVLILLAEVIYNSIPYVKNFINTKLKKSSTKSN